MFEYWKCPFCLSITEAPNEICSGCGDPYSYRNHQTSEIDGNGLVKFTDGSIYELSDIRPREELDWFVKHMEIKLKENDVKGGWDDCSLDYLMMRLEDEVFELKQEIFKTSVDSDKIFSEAADVANFAMMIADRFRIKRNG